MSFVLRIILVLTSLMASGYAIRKIRKSQMKIGDAIYWFFLAFLFIVFSIFPQIPIWATKICGIQSPVNFVFLVMVFLVMLKLFSIALKVSQLESKLEILTEELAYRDNIMRENCGIIKKTEGKADVAEELS